MFLTDYWLALCCCSLNIIAIIVLHFTYTQLLSSQYHRPLQCLHTSRFLSTTSSRPPRSVSSQTSFAREEDEYEDEDELEDLDEVGMADEFKPPEETEAPKPEGVSHRNPMLPPEEEYGWHM